MLKSSYYDTDSSTLFFVAENIISLKDCLLKSTEKRLPYKHCLKMINDLTKQLMHSEPSPSIEITKAFDNYINMSINYFKTLWNNDTMKFLISNPTKANLASLATKGLYLFMYFQNIYYSVQSSSSTNKIINIIHEKLNKMTQYVKLSDKLKTVCEAHHINDLTDFISYSNIKEDIHVYENYFNFLMFCII